MQLQPRRLLPIAPGLALALFGWSCTSTPVPVDLSSDHPASPRAVETPFVPPPNPFAEASPVVPAEAAGSSMESGSHGGHGGHQGHQPAADNEGGEEPGAAASPHGGPASGEGEEPMGHDHHGHAPDPPATLGGQAPKAQGALP